MPSLTLRRRQSPDRSWPAVITLSVGLLCLVLSSARGDDAPPRGPEAGHVKKTELHEHMGDIEEAMKKLRRTIRKPDAQAESLDLIAKIQQAALTCKSMVPSRAGTLPEADRAKFVLAYRKEMAAFIGQTLQLETAVIDGDVDKAREIYKDLQAREDAGHDKFMQKDEKEKAKTGA